MAAKVEATEAVEPASVDVLVEVLEGRSEFYLALSGFYLQPLSQEQIDTMARTDYSAFSAGEPLLEEGFNDITRVLRKRHTGTRQMLAIDFTSSFGGTQMYMGRTAVPYASVFLSETGLLSQAPRAEIFRVFKRNYLRTGDTSTPDDHLSFMLEFLAVMSSRIIESLKESRVDDALAGLEECKGFINNHILTWFDDFSELANMFFKSRFYRGVLKVTKGYLLMDLQTIDDIQKALGEMA